MLVCIYQARSLRPQAREEGECESVGLLLRKVTGNFVAPPKQQVGGCGQSGRYLVYMEPFNQSYQEAGKRIQASK
jgi:hypothetical protein